jgi:hypothetical protein
MSCPYYQDYTRECIQSFPKVMSHTSFSVCESEKYVNCYAYFALQAGFQCKYQDYCVNDLTSNIPIIARLFIENDVAMQVFKDSIQKYCSSKENHVYCACYKLHEMGIKPPVELLPDGSKFRLRDIILRKKIVLE